MTFRDESNIIMNSFENLNSKTPFWNVNLPENLWDIDSEDVENMDVLCELVRKQYLKHLRQTLFDNLKVSKSNQKSNLCETQQFVDICTAEMEKQALRRCMVASIYRQGMSNMINEVKTCTKKSMMYVFLKHIIESNNQLYEKYFGSKNSTKKSVGTNTEHKVNKIASTQTEQKMDHDNNLFVNNINENPVHKSNVPSSSYDVQSKISETNVYNNLNSLLKSSSSSSNCSSNISMEADNFNFSESADSQGNSVSQNCATDDVLGFNSLLRDLQDSPESEQKTAKLEEHNISCGPIESKKHYSKTISQNTVRPKKINEILSDKYKSERVAKAYELRRCMNEMPSQLQIRLNNAFIDLFGHDHSYESDPLSEEEEHIIAHKRIVKMVVGYMTPYYKAHRISRQMFKSLAKLISKTLMDRGYDADEETVAKGVGEFFTDNRCITSFEDLYQ